MKDKKITGMLVAIIMIIIVVMIIGVKIMILVDEYNDYDERTNEEYMAILIDNKEDFEYVAEMMWQWPIRSCINIDGGISSDNTEIEDEILNNEEFNRHLKNIYNLNEIDYIIVKEGKVIFDFRIYPQNCFGGLYYIENSETAEDDYGAYKIDEHWVLYMIPGT